MLSGDWWLLLSFEVITVANGGTKVMTLRKFDWFLHMQESGKPRTSSFLSTSVLVVLEGSIGTTFTSFWNLHSEWFDMDHIFPFHRWCVLSFHTTLDCWIFLSGVLFILKTTESLKNTCCIFVVSQKPIYISIIFYFWLPIHKICSCVVLYFQTWLIKQLKKRSDWDTWPQMTEVVI